MVSKFKVLDGGKRQEFNGGMVRDVTEGKVDYTLTHDGPMFLRWALHLAKGAAKYNKRNWMKASGEEEYERFLESAHRHFMIWFYWRKFGLNIEDPQEPVYGKELTEDHASAAFFNINGCELLKERTIYHGKNKEGS